MSGMRGKCMTILNIHGDFLWSTGDRSQPPFIATPVAQATDFSETSDSLISNLAFANGEENQTKKYVSGPIHQTLEQVKVKEPLTKGTKGTDETDTSDSDDETNSIDQEKLLEECFLIAIKYKDVKLPIIVSTFMKTMQTCW